MTIVFLSASGGLGGAERSLLDALAGLRAEKPSWGFHLLAAAPGPLLARARELGATAEVLAFPASLARLGDWSSGSDGGPSLPLGLLLAAPGAAAYALRLRRALAKLEPDVVHSNGFKMHLLARWAKPRRAALVWHMHDYAGSRPFMSRVLRRHAGGGTTAVANSRSVADDLARVCPNLTRITPVHNAVDLERFTPEGPRADLDALAGLSPAGPGTLRVGLFATLARWKGHETFLKALALLPASSPVRGYVVGGALYETAGSQYSIPELRALAERLGVARKVGFTGFVSDAPAALRALDIVVHASTLPEPFGLAIAEGMACGRPVVVSLAGGAAEIVTDGADALAHSPGDEKALAGRISELAGDPGLRARLGRAARAAAERRFGRARLARELVLAYEAAVGPSGAR